MQIKVLGSGCPASQATASVIEGVLRKRNLDISVERVQDLRENCLYAVQDPPAVVINDKVVHSGGVPTVERVEQWLARAPQPA